MVGEDAMEDEIILLVLLKLIKLLLYLINHQIHYLHPVFKSRAFGFHLKKL